MDLRRVCRQIDKDQVRHRRRLRHLLQQPSVSQLGSGMAECARLVATMFREAGARSVRIFRTAGYPIVFGRLDVGAPRTLLVYFMYDTMPYEEEGWTSPPMGARTVPMRLPSGRVRALVNRGADNTKGPLAAFLNMLEAIHRSGEQPPVNLLLLAEGEEELGSPSLAPFVEERRALLEEATGCYFPSFAQDVNGDFDLFLGVKGTLYFELECSGKRWGRGPRDFDIHSSYAACVDSPVWRLLQALSTMVDPTSDRILIDGFYDAIVPPTSEEEGLLRGLGVRFDPAAYKQMLRIDRFSGEDEDPERLARAYTRNTTLNIDGIWGGYTLTGCKTVLPHKAACKMDVRLVPNQRVEEILPMVRRHLDRHGYGDIELRQVDTAYDWARVSAAEPIVQALVRTCRAFGVEPRIWPTSGWAAPFWVFTRKLGIPFAIGGLGHGAQSHSPNEYIVLEGNRKVLGLAGVEKSFARFLLEYAADKALTT